MGNLGPAVRIEAHGSLVARPIRLSSRLHPHNCIHILVVQNLLVCRGPNAKTSVADVAPLTPVSPDTRLARTSLIDDKVRGVSRFDEVYAELVDVVVFIPRVVPLGIGLTLLSDVWVVIRDVDGQTPDLGGWVDGHCTLEDFGKDFSRGCEIVVPAKPATVSSVKVESCIFKLQLGDGL